MTSYDNFAAGVEGGQTPAALGGPLFEDLPQFRFGHSI